MTGADRDPEKDACAWSEFLRAATQPSPVAAFGALAVSAVLLATAAFVVAPRLLETVDPGRLMVDSGDRDVVLMHRTLQLCSSAPAPCAVALLGASSVECALSSQGDLERRLSAGLEARGDRRRVAVSLLMTSGMTLEQQCAVTDRIAEHVTGALVIAVDPELPAWELLDPHRSRPLERDVLESAAIAEEYRLAGFEPPATTGIYVLDHYEFLAPRMLAALTRILSPPITVAPLQQATRRLAEARMNEQLLKDARIGNRRLSQPLDQQLGLEILGRMIDRFRARSSAPVVLLETPRHPRLRAGLRHSDRPWFDVYLDVMRRFAAAHGALHWCIDVDAGVSESDYGDSLHIFTDEARDRFTGLLAERLADIAASAAEERR